METFAATSGAHYVELLSAVTSAAAAFKTAVAERAELLAGWRARAEQLGAPMAHDSPVVPSDAHGGMACAGWADLIAGRRRLAPLDAGQWLSDALGAGPGRAFATQVLFAGSRANLAALQNVDGPP